MTGLVAAVCAAVFMAPATAGAAQAPENPRAKAGPHCVADAVTQKTTCYDTFRESIAAATGGRITDAPATPQKAATDKKFLAKLNAPAETAANTPASRTTARSSQTIAAVLYEHGNYYGQSLTLTTYVPCGIGSRFGVLDLGSDFYRFDNLTSSLIASGDCQIELFENPNLTGASQKYSGSVGWVGNAMNDHASSVAIT
ncbi:peptidase inhibitor family I36 protein [Streptomyces sp. NPDC002476]|uniref:peptidase inhibitor family I36 protein n=1 Tax=Streptomyces sp. NPDC002476 TaxID=3364648 RepID=UPI0036C46AA3